MKKPKKYMVDIIRVEKQHHMYEVEAVNADSAKIFARRAYHKGDKAKDSWVDEDIGYVVKATNLARWVHEE